MRIIVLSYSLTSGGAERFAVDLSNELALEGHQVMVVTTDSDAIRSNGFYRSELRPAVQYVNIGARSGHRLTALLGVNRIIRRFKPDVVHVNTQLIPVLLPLLCFPKVRFVNTIHSVAEAYLKSRLLKPFYRYLYSRRVIPVTISAYCSQSFRSLYGLETDCIIVNGCNRPSCTEKVEEVRNQMRVFSQGRPVFIHIARYIPIKNQQVLLDAFSKLPQLRLVVIGKGYPDAMVQSVNATQVWFVGETSNVADYLECSDFFILSSLHEGLPMTLLEAMSYGIVPISTPAGGVVDVICHGENGFLARGFDVEALVVAIQNALSCPIDREKLKQAYQEHYTMRSCAAQYERLFMSLL